MSKTTSFEEAISQLETVINTLEDDDISLDSAVAEFEQGVQAVRSCQKALSSAEGRLTELLKGEDGELVESLLGLTLDTLQNNENRI